MNSLTRYDTSQVLGFGPYTFIAHQRLLLEGRRPLAVGNRALDILQVLLEHAGELVSKEQLLAQVWPNIVVEEINLRVHIAALRRALGDDQKSPRYILNIPQQGYCFIAEVQRHTVEAVDLASAGRRATHNLPARLSHVIGRDDSVLDLMSLVRSQSLVCLAGPAGVGKTSMALRTAEGLLDYFPEGVWYIDLAAVSDATQLRQQVARSLELPLFETATTQSLIDGLRGRASLLILDHCEHQLAVCRGLLETLMQAGLPLKILTISREPLGLAGEFVRRLEPLKVPPGMAIRCIEEALQYPAVQLFIRGAKACQHGFKVSERELGAVIEICRRLDGLPLAIELAVAQIDALGLMGVQAQLDNCVQLLSLGRRTAVARHQTLQAALDSSYLRLSATEQRVMRRLALAEGAFSLEDAHALVERSVVAPSGLLTLIERLAAKSLLSHKDIEGVTHYRFLNTTRAYALQAVEPQRISFSYPVRSSVARTLSGDDLAVQFVEQLSRLQ